MTGIKSIGNPNISYWLKGMGRGWDYMSELFNSELFIITEICTSSLELSFSLSRLLVRYNIVQTLLIAILTSFSLSIQLLLILAFVLSRLIRTELAYPWVGWGISERHWKDSPSVCLSVSVSLSASLCLPASLCL